MLFNFPLHAFKFLEVFAHEAFILKVVVGCRGLDDVILAMRPATIGLPVCTSCLQNKSNELLIKMF